MEINNAVNMLAALGQVNRLEVFRYLVQAGPAGAAAGTIAEAFGIPGATLSFHLATLKQAGLISVRRDGRSLIYAPDFEQMNGLVAYLFENCCGGHCSTNKPKTGKRRKK